MIMYCTPSTRAPDQYWLPEYIISMRTLTQYGAVHMGIGLGYMQVRPYHHSAAEVYSTEGIDLRPTRLLLPFP